MQNENLSFCLVENSKGICMICIEICTGYDNKNICIEKNKTIYIYILLYINFQNPKCYLIIKIPNVMYKNPKRYI